VFHNSLDQYRFKILKLRIHCVFLGALRKFESIYTKVSAVFRRRGKWLLRSGIGFAFAI